MTDKELSIAYDEFLEQEAPVSQEVRDTYILMNRVFDEYLSAVTENNFRNAFMFGYTKGLKASGTEAWKGGD